MAIFDQPLPGEARAGLARLGLADAHDAIWAAADEFIQSEQAHRRQLRMSAIEVALTDAQQAEENARNDAGLGHIDRAHAVVQNARAALDPAVLRELDDRIRTAEGQDALTRARQSFATQFAQHDLDPTEFREVLAEWDRVHQLAVSGGLTGVLGDMDSTTAREGELRRGPSRGRESASPLPLWKIILVAAAIGAALAAVIACFVWFGCTWVAPLLQWYAPSLATTVALGC